MQNELKFFKLSDIYPHKRELFKDTFTVSFMSELTRRLKNKDKHSQIQNTL